MGLLESLDGAGPYISVFIGMAGALTWAMRDRSKAWGVAESRTNDLLAEREKRASEQVETAKLLSDSSQKLAEHTKVLDKVLDRWTLSSSV
jgi:hypothetical protein